MGDALFDEENGGDGPGDTARKRQRSWTSQEEDLEETDASYLQFLDSLGSDWLADESYGNCSGVSPQKRAVNLFNESDDGNFVPLLTQSITEASLPQKVGASDVSNGPDVPYSSDIADELRFKDSLAELLGLSNPVETLDAKVDLPVNVSHVYESTNFSQSQSEKNFLPDKAAKTIKKRSRVSIYAHEKRAIRNRLFALSSALAQQKLENDKTICLCSAPEATTMTSTPLKNALSKDECFRTAEVASSHADNTATVMKIESQSHSEDREGLADLTSCMSTRTSVLDWLADLPEFAQSIFPKYVHLPPRAKKDAAAFIEQVTHSVARVVEGKRQSAGSTEVSTHFMTEQPMPMCPTCGGPIPCLFCEEDSGEPQYAEDTSQQYGQVLYQPSTLRLARLTCHKEQFMQKVNQYIQRAFGAVLTDHRMQPDDVETLLQQYLRANDPGFERIWTSDKKLPYVVGACVYILCRVTPTKVPVTLSWIARRCHVNVSSLAALVKDVILQLGISLPTNSQGNSLEQLVALFSQSLISRAADVGASADEFIAEMPNSGLEDYEDGRQEDSEARKDYGHFTELIELNDFLGSNDSERFKAEDNTDPPNSHGVQLQFENKGYKTEATGTDDNRLEDLAAETHTALKQDSYSIADTMLLELFGEPKTSASETNISDLFAHSETEENAVIFGTDLRQRQKVSTVLAESTVLNTSNVSVPMCRIMQPGTKAVELTVGDSLTMKYPGESQNFLNGQTQIPEEVTQRGGTASSELEVGIFKLRQVKAKFQGRWDTQMSEALIALASKILCAVHSIKPRLYKERDAGCGIWTDLAALDRNVSVSTRDSGLIAATVYFVLRHLQVRVPLRAIAAIWEIPLSIIAARMSFLVDALHELLIEKGFTVYRDKKRRGSNNEVVRVFLQHCDLFME